MPQGNGIAGLPQGAEPPFDMLRDLRDRADRGEIPRAYYHLAAQEHMPSLPPSQVAWWLSQLAPGAGVLDASGRMAELPSADTPVGEAWSGEFMPSMAEHWQTGHPVIASLQGLGVAGDAFYGVPLVGLGLGATVGTALKLPLIVTKVMQRLFGAGKVVPKSRILRSTDVSAEGIAALRQAKSAEAWADNLRGEALRQQHWGELSGAAGREGRRSPSTGHFVGYGPRFTTPQAVSGVDRSYANRVMRGLEAGVEPGYFYGQGSRAISGLFPDAGEHARFARLLGSTSTMVPPRTNLGYAVGALEQRAAGVRPRAGLFPNKSRHEVAAILRRMRPWLGFKRERYGNLLGPEALLSAGHPLSRLPPTDMWEWGTMGGRLTPAGKYQPPSGPAQVAAADAIRGRAGVIVNRERAAKGLRPLTPDELQEVNWAVARAEAEGRPITVRPEDTIQGSIPRFTAYATHEQAPGAGTGHLEGFLGLLRSQREAFAADPRSSWAAPHGSDALYAGMKLPVAESLENVGTFRVTPDAVLEINPGSVSRPLVQSRAVVPYKAMVDGKLTDVKKFGDEFFTGDNKIVTPDAGSTPVMSASGVGPRSSVSQTGELTPEGRIVLESGESARAYIDVQNAGAAHRIIPDRQNTAGARTSLVIPLDRKATMEEIIAMDDIAGRYGMFVVDSGEGLRLINDPFTEMGSARQAGNINLNRERGGSGGLVEQIVEAIDAPKASVKVVPSQIDTVYQDYTNRWAQGVGSGASTTKFLGDMDRVPWLRDAMEPILQRKALYNLARDAEMAQSSGLSVRTDVQRGRRIFGEEGFRGLRNALESGVILPSVVAAVVAPAVLFGQNESPQM